MAPEGYVRHHVQNRNLTLTLLLTSDKKVPCTLEGCVLGPKHVNSGVTFTSASSIDVFIFREEEVFKVMLHEFIHAFGLDYGGLYQYEIDAAEKRLMDQWKVNKPLRVNESFTDTWACLLNICIFTRMYVLLFNHQQLESERQCLHVLFECERKYILEKAGEVWRHLQSQKKLLGGHVKEDSHVISYYIFKAYNFYTMENFLQTFFNDKNAIDHSDQTYDDYVDSLFQSNPRMFLIEKKWEKSLRMSNLDVSSLIKRWKEKLLKTLVGMTIHQNAF